VSDALSVAQRNLIEAMRTHRDAWLVQLGADANERRARVLALTDELAALLTEAESPAAAARWYEMTLDPTRTWGGVANLYVPEAPIYVAGTSQQRDHVLAGIIAAAE
jgi:hypothetical protein